MIGIYKITSPKGKIYIGQSVDIGRRFKEYKNTNNSKRQIKLNNSFLKYGVENHDFTIIELCDIKDLNKRERYYQDLYKCIYENGLNLKLQDCSIKKQIHSQYVIDKISKSMTLKHKELEYSIKHKNARLGKKFSDETKRKISLSAKKRYKNSKASEYIGIFGGNSLASKRVIDLIDNKIYESAKIASNELNINYSTLKNKLQGKTKCNRFKYINKE